MPLIEVTYDETLSEPLLRRLGQLLSDVVTEAVACPEEPFTGPPQPGDVEIRFRERGPIDVGDLNCLVEVRTKLFASRLADKQDRAETIRARLVAAEPGVGQMGCG